MAAITASRWPISATVRPPAGSSSSRKRGERAGERPKTLLGMFEQRRATMQPRPKPNAGLPMARLAGETQAGLRAALPSLAAAANRVDIFAALLANSRLFSESCPSSRAIPQRTRS